MKQTIPKYSLSEELINSISHGIGALLGITALVLALIKASAPLEIVTISIYGASLIILYTISCIYHALSPKTKGKKVLRIIDHCSVHFLVLGTYLPVSLLGVGGKLGITLCAIVTSFSILGIVLSAINVDKYSKISVICHLISGWSILIGLPQLITTLNINGLLLLLAGGIFYTVGSILYGIGSKIKYMHSIFHLFCIAGSLTHFLAIILYLL